MAQKINNRLDDCIACQAKCCRHVATIIEKPTCKRDYDNIRWYLMHEDVQVFIDKEGEWTLEFFTKCENLLDNHTCSKYADRPGVCRDYPEDGTPCEYEHAEPLHKILFTRVGEFEKYLESRGIDWRWKKLKQ